MYDIIIVGAGTAGMTAALYALRANKKVLVLESQSYGGQIINAPKIENYPGIASISGFEFATNLYNQIKDLGAEFRFETVKSLEDHKEYKIVLTSSNKYQAKAVIMATGAQKRKLNLELEDKFIGRGISYCATCDGNFYKKKTVAIVGGGNTALEDALYLSGVCEKVFLIHRRDTFTAEDKYLDELKTKVNVEFILNSNVVSLNGDEKLKSITIKNNDGNITELEVSGLFIAIGHIPQNQAFANILDLDEFGYIKSSDGVHTNIDRIYVAGDARVKTLRQLTTAASDGSIAATTAINEIKNI